MIETLNEQAKIILLLLLIFFSLVILGWLIIFGTWFAFKFIFKGNTKNRTAGEYYESILKYEKINVKSKTKSLIIKYSNVKKNQINLTKSEQEKENIWNIYNVIAYIQVWKWKQSHKKPLFFLTLANIFFIISLIGIFLIGLTLILNDQEILEHYQFELMTTILAYMSLGTLLTSWFISAFAYERIGRDCNKLASEYLNDQDLVKFKTISILRTIFIASELWGRISF